MERNKKVGTSVLNKRELKCKTAISLGFKYEEAEKEYLKHKNNLIQWKLQEL